MRTLNKTTIKPILKFIGAWDRDIHSLNTQGASHYHFTLDKYEDKNSWRGGFAWGLDGCYVEYGLNKRMPCDEYAIELSTGDVYKLDDKKIILKTRG